MHIILAGPRGFCAGVNMAIESLEAALGLYGTPIYVYHEIVHNRWVVERFRRQGAVFVNDLSEVPSGAHLLYSAHGVSPEVRDEAARRGLHTIDATCPLVTKVHREAVRFAEAGYTIVLIGHAGHDEVVGVMGEAARAMRLVESPEDVDRLEVADPEKLAYLTQTTLSLDDAARTIRRLRERFPKIASPDQVDICYATQNRQGAVRALAQAADVVLVIGSRNSSNSRRLAEMARHSGVRASDRRARGHRRGLVQRQRDGAGDRRGQRAGRRRAGVHRLAPGAVCRRGRVADVGRGADRFSPPPSLARIPEGPCPDMKINDLEFHLVEIGCTGMAEPVRSLLVRLTTDSGLKGWGESGLAWRPGELAARRDALLPVLAGRSVFDIEELHTLEALASAPLRTAVEMACLDLAGKAVGQPLCRLLGGEYRQRIPLAVRLTGRRPERLAQLARELAVQGFYCQVLAASGEAELDCKMLAAVRQCVGDRMELRLDGMAEYDMETARDLCRRNRVRPAAMSDRPLADAGPWVAGVVGAADVGAAGGASGDSLPRRRPGRRPLRRGDDGGDRPRSGGGDFSRCACAIVAGAAGVSAILAQRPTLGVAAAALLHIAAATPILSGCNESAYHQLQDDVLAEPLLIESGMMTVPQAPGLGVEVDRAKIERYGVVW